MRLIGTWSVLYNVLAYVLLISVEKYMHVGCQEIFFVPKFFEIGAELKRLRIFLLKTDPDLRQVQIGQ